jgi:hypothetical protein
VNLDRVTVMLTFAMIVVAFVLFAVWVDAR